MRAHEGDLAGCAYPSRRTGRSRLRCAVWRDLVRRASADGLASDAVDRLALVVATAAEVGDRRPRTGRLDGRRPRRASRVIEARAAPALGLVVATTPRPRCCRRGWPPAGISPPSTGCSSGAGRPIPDRIWAALHELPEAAIPALGQLDLLGAVRMTTAAMPRQPVRPDGYLRPEWTGGGWARTPARRAAWAALALEARRRCSTARLAALEVGGDPVATARSESAAELLCAELEVDGLPVDRDRAEQIIASFIGPRPCRRDRRSAAAAPGATTRCCGSRRPGVEADLRNPGVGPRAAGPLRHRGAPTPGRGGWSRSSARIRSSRRC